MGKGEKTIKKQPWGPFAGFLLFKKVGSGAFNDLHVSVTTNSANCGQGFHISAYSGQVLGDYQAAVAVGRLYYTVDPSTGKPTKIENGRLQPQGNHESIHNSIFYGELLREACEFYCELHGIHPVKSATLRDSDFPTFAALRPTQPLSSGLRASAPEFVPSGAPLVPNPVVTPSGAAVGNPEFFAMVSKNLDYSNGYSLF